MWTGFFDKQEKAFLLDARQAGTRHGGWGRGEASIFSPRQEQGTGWGGGGGKHLLSHLENHGMLGMLCKPLSRIRTEEGILHQKVVSTQQQQRMSLLCCE